MELQSPRATDHEQETSQPTHVQDEKCHEPAEERTMGIKDQQGKGVKMSQACRSKGTTGTVGQDESQSSSDISLESGLGR